MTWATDYFRPSRAHLRETCDGRPRLLDTDYGMVGVAVCREWLLDDVLDDDVLDDVPAAGSAAVERCPACVVVHRQLGGTSC
jgi:hypothetical protein